MSYQKIGDKFDLSRERIHQLHDEISPDEDRAEKRRLYRIQKKKEKLFNDKLFRTSYRILTHHFSPESIEFIMYKDSTAFKTHVVKIKDKEILLKKADKFRHISNNVKAFRIRNSRKQGDFIFSPLYKNHSVLIPKPKFPKGDIIFFDSEKCKYYGFKDNFNPLLNL